MFNYYNALKKSAEENLWISKKLLSGFVNMMDIQEVQSSTTPKELLYEEDKMKVYHYLPVVKKPHPIPVLISYAFVNRQYMLDLQDDRSIIKKWLQEGLDIYLIDWGYPDQTDRYVTMEDYLDDYMNNAVELVRKRHNLEKINLMGICQGGTMSIIYTALYPDKIRNLINIVTPFDFSTNDGLLITWSRHLNVDNIVDTFGTVPGPFMNVGFNMLKPFQLTLDKYIDFIEHLDEKEAIRDFLRMEKWIYDSPAQAGEMFRKFIKDLYQENKLAKNELEVGGRRVNLQNLIMPVLTVLAQYDHLVPPAATRPIMDAIPSQDKALLEYPTGHIGMFVSSKSQKEVAPTVAKWIIDRGKKRA